MSQIELTGEFYVSPQELARMFWECGSDGQCDFFAELYRVAGHKLCVQMACVAQEAVQRYLKGDMNARYGLETVAGHGETMRELEIDFNVHEAKRELDVMLKGAKP